MSIARRPRPFGASILTLALVAGLLSFGAPQAAAVAASSPGSAAPSPSVVLGERTQAWIDTAIDPAGVTAAMSSYSSKLSSALDNRMRYVRDGLLRVMVSVSDRTASVESFVDRSTTWVRWYFDNPRFYAAVTPDQLATLLRLRAVMFVEPDVKLSYFTSASTVDVHARSLAGDGTGVWSFDKTAGAHGALRSDIPGLSVDQATGKGVTVAITDSGIDRTHLDFGGWDCAPDPFTPCESRIVRAVTTEHLIGGSDLGDSLPTTEASSGHGTHVAGIVAGNGYYARDGGDDAAAYGGDGVPFGVAPQANLIMTKNGDTLWAGLSSFGLEWQLKNAAKYGIRVSSNSWGCIGGCAFNGSSATGQLFKDMYKAGIVTVFAVGNDGGTISGTTFSGNAQSPYVLGVASYQNEDHRLASSSSRGSDNTLPDPSTWTPESEPVNGERRPDVGAPGVGIWAARTLTGGAASGVPRANTTDVTGGGGCCIREYATMGGTLMATPHVAGAAALAFSVCPTATPLDVMRAVMATAGKDVLKTTGSALAEPFEVGYGALEVRAAVDWLLAHNCGSSGGGDPTPTPTPTSTPTATPTPSPTPTESVGGTTYYFHSPTGIGNMDRTNSANSHFNKVAPTDTGASSFYDLAPQNGAPQAIYDPYWTGTIEETVRRLDVRFWQRMPIGDAVGEVAFKVTLWAGATPHELPAFTATVPPTVGNATSLIEHSFTTMLGASGKEVPLEVALAGQPAAITIANNDIPEAFAGIGGYIQYDSVTKPAGFTVNGGVSPDPTTSPTVDPTTEPTDSPPPPAGRGTYPVQANDSLFGDQWGMTKIQAPQAWQERNATGFGINIAIVDSGLDLGHPDFACPGKVRVLAGANIGATSKSPQDTDGHGTHVAGIAGACTNNGEGVVGVAPDATLIPVRVFDEADLDKAMADGIRFATDNGAHVINLSIGPSFVTSHFGPDGYPQTEDALEYARSNGVVIAAAAGNWTQPTCEFPSLSRNVICVVATDRDDIRAYYTDFPVNVDRNADEPKMEPVVAAPGGQGTFCDEGIVSTYLRTEESFCYTSGYESLDGTSMSSPHVAGLAALLYDRIGGERSKANADTIVQTILDTSDDLYTPGWDPIVGYGRINALSAVRAIEVASEPENTTVAFTADTTQAAQHSDNATIGARLTDESGDAIEGAELVFELSGAETRSWTEVTNADGVASATKTLSEAPGDYQLTVHYAGKADVHKPSSDDGGVLVVWHEDTTSALDAAAPSGKGKKATRTLTATISDPDGSSFVAGRVVSFFSDGELMGTATTNEQGVAVFNTPHNYAYGHRVYRSDFDGDEYYLGSSATQTG